MFLLILALGCGTTPKRAAFATLASVGETVDLAMNGYLDLVITGQVKKETLPKISRIYEDFQFTYRAALALAQFGLPLTADGSAPGNPAGGVQPTADVLAAANHLFTAIAESKR